MTGAVQDWRTLPAGRELDAVVAERRMGAAWWRSSATGNRALFLEKPPEWFTERADGTERRVGDWMTYGGFPAYSTDIAAALLLVSADHHFSVNYDAITQTWWAGVAGDGPVHEAPTMPHAICRAVLAFAEAQP